jgi:hypothetical protein
MSGPAAAVANNRRRVNDFLFIAFSPSVAEQQATGKASDKHKPRPSSSAAAALRCKAYTRSAQLRKSTPDGPQRLGRPTALSAASRPRQKAVFELHASKPV